MKRKLGSKLYIALFLLFMYLPILVLIAFSFNESRSRSHWTGFTFAWYNKLFHNQEIWSAVLNTLIIAIIASIVATAIGTVSAVGVHFLGKRFKRIMILLTNLPIVNPEIVTGVSLMLMFTFLRVEMGFKTLILAHVSFNVPYIIFNVLPKLKQMDKHLCDAAMDLGCNWVQVFFKVILPEISPGVMAGFLMAIAFSLDDFVVSYFTSGPPYLKTYFLAMFLGMVLTLLLEQFGLEKAF
ncbi:spermidine/putrescine ABC transporter permease [Clostridia bacterium]|nr:spermidine/putrescine ABC transporter permease [Clostridia bacterium]